MSFDTHAFYNRLKNVGFSEQQAEAIAEIQKETATAAIEQTKHDFRLDDITTNKDLDARIKETELKIELVKADLQRDIANVQADLSRDISKVSKEISDTKAELSRTILNVGVGVGLTQIVAVFILFLRMTGKA
jgi:DNA gyrase/topoisomerase IV subunit A